ncbi:MAG TPA: 4-alpha-glucanotransferase [Elusimicrobia bacterium]|jgi:alpha-amylase|nr:4-alpha-glucanotransferase [Elusimicrobiota bacterium]
MKKIYFLFGIHNHQPIGNFPEIFEKAYQKAYAPFIEVLLRHPLIKLNFHCSGILWEWLKEHHPEFLDRVKKLLKDRRLELLTGGYYEPILPVIPDRDKFGQIAKQTKFLKEEFGITASGVWLAERVWEPHLAKSLAESKIEYTIVDDTHFLSAGIHPEDLTGYFLTEEEGETLRIFPISQRLRYLIPFGIPEEIIEYLRSYSERKEDIGLTIIDDGEKFGIWPETHKHVYGDGWLDKFFTLLEANADWLISMTFSEYLDQFSPRGRIYLPTAAYFEMSEWAIPNIRIGEDFSRVLKNLDVLPGVVKEKLRPFLKGGFWRNFLVKYPEANNIHKKMLYVSEKVNKAVESVKCKVKGKESTLTPYTLHLTPQIQQALDLLYAGQCNCAYWHGVFGGLYLPHLRQAVYRNLIKAEDIVNSLIKKEKIHSDLIDFNCDGKEELIVETSTYNLYFDLAQGGTLFEWDFIPAGVNLVNVLTRRSEVYHKHLQEYLKERPKESETVKTIHELVKVKEEGLENYLFYDWYNRNCLIDHFLHPHTSWDDFRKCQYGEQGDFVNQSYNLEVKKGKNQIKIHFRRRGVVWSGEEKIPLSLEKEIVVDNSALIQVNYRLGNFSTSVIGIWFACEFNLALSEKIDDGGELLVKNSWERIDENQKMKIRFDFPKPVNVWYYPLETVSSSESGFERTYQGTIFLPHWKLNIKPDKTWSTSFSITVEHFK